VDTKRLVFRETMFRNDHYRDVMQVLMRGAR
jgi:hypothetical protein